jgi:tetratricopeptide (TPR) repeat protein
MDDKAGHSAHWLPRIIFAVLGLMLLSCCASKEKVQTAPPTPTPELENKTAEAERFFKKGCYVGFKKAIEIYQELYAQPTMRGKITVSFIKTLILMTVRERELGILNDRYIQKAAEILKENASLRSFVPYVELANTMYPKTKGIMRDINVMGTVKVVDDVLKNVQLMADLKRKAETDDYYAYLYLSFYSSFANYLDQKEELSGFAKSYPDSIFFKYKTAAADLREDPKLLEALVAAEPEFYEAYYHLGELALEGKKLLEAEKNFIKASEGIPESPQITIYLGSIYMGTEEFEKSLEYFEKTISLAPAYRDAILGKAMCLSYMGKYNEAIEILNKLVAMGFYLMGESHYWLARNYHELKDIEKAQLHIEESKGRLPTDSDVFSLAGTIAFEKNELDKAEKEFTESLRYNGANIEAVFGLAKVCAQKQKWLDSALFYTHATVAVGQSESIVAERIRQIKVSTLAEERKAKMIAKKEQQLKILAATKATGYYDAAVGYFNAGRGSLALEMAEKAASHPQFKEAAAELIKKIK